MIVSHDRDFLERLVTRTLVFTGDGIVDLYGGYEDYLKFYKKDANQKSAIRDKEKNKTNVINAEEISKKQTKLSYKYQRLLEVLPKEIEEIESNIAILENKLMQGDLYSNDPEAFHKYSKNLEENKKLLDEKILQWLEVENMNNG